MDLYESKTYTASVLRVGMNLPKEELTFIVTGATGLIGSYIIDVLMYSNLGLGKKHTVYALGKNKAEMEKRFYKVKNWGKLIFVEQDVCDPIKLDVKADYLIHTASNADPVTYAKFPVETLITNVYGTNNVLNYAKGTKTRVLLLSSFEVYGDINNIDMYSEEDLGLLNFNLLRSCYPEGKRCMELLAKCYNDEYGVDYVIGRLPSVFGPTMKENDSKAHAQFFRNAAFGKDVILKSDGKQKRSYCYVMEAVSALFYILFNGKSSEVYNISNKDSVITIFELASYIAKFCNVDLLMAVPTNIEKKGYSIKKDSVLDSTKLYELGWDDDYPLKFGIEDTIKILKEAGE